MATSIPKLTTTVEGFIESSENIRMSYSNLSLKNLNKDNDISLIVYNVLDDYIDELKEASVEYEFTNEEYIKFCQAPKLLADVLYNNTELDFIILRINGLYDPQEFTMRKIKILKRTTINDLLSQIYRSNKKFIDEYNQRNNE